MKKIISSLLTAVLVLSLCLVCASALDINTYDPEAHLTSEEIEEVQKTAEKIKDEFGYYAMFCLADNTYGFNSVYDYAQFMYNEHSTEENAIIFVHDLSSNLCDFFAVENDANVYFSDEVQEEIFNKYNLCPTYSEGVEFFYTTIYEILSGNNTNELIIDSAETEIADSFTSVERTLPLVVDNAGIFSEEMKKDFIAKCEAFTEEFSAEIAIITVTDLEGKSSQEFADDFYDYNGYGYGENDDGLLILYLPGTAGNRELAISTHGTARENISGEEVDEILNAVVAFLQYDNYTDAFDAFLEKAEGAIKPTPPILWFLVCLAVGLVIGLIITNSMASDNYSVHRKETATDYVKQGTLVISGSNDMFVNSVVRAVPKPKANGGRSGSTGGSSSHTSSSGRSHGGGSVSF